MASVNRSHQSGHARAFIDHEPFSMANRLFVYHEDHIITPSPSGGGLVFTPMDEGVRPPITDAFTAWSDMVEDPVVDIFKAIGKALDIYSDEPSQAYKQGYAEGVAATLREWNESLRE